MKRIKNRITEERVMIMRAVYSLRQCLPSAGQNKLEGLITSNDDDGEVWRKLPSKDTNHTGHWYNWEQGQATPRKVLVRGMLQ